MRPSALLKLRHHRQREHWECVALPQPHLTSNRLGCCSSPRIAGEECQVEGCLPGGGSEQWQVGPGLGRSLCMCGPLKPSRVTSCGAQAGFCPMLCTPMT